MYCLASSKSLNIRNIRLITEDSFPRMCRLPATGLRAAVSEYWLWSLKGPQDSQVNSRHGLSKEMVMVPQFLSLADSFVFLVP